MEGPEGIHLSTCMTCNTVLGKDAYSVVNTRLGSNGILLSEVLRQCLNLPESVFETKTVLSICSDCLKSYSELVELELKYRNLKAQLWNQHKEVVSTWMQHNIYSGYKDESAEITEFNDNQEDDSQNFDERKKFKENVSSPGESVPDGDTLSSNYSFRQRKENSHLQGDNFSVSVQDVKQLPWRKSNHCEPFCTCKVCGMWFKGKKVPKAHMSEHEEFGEIGGESERNHAFKSNICRYCNAEFAYIKDMWEHMQQHVVDCLVYKCRVCETSLTTKAGALYHAKLHDESVDNKFNIENAFEIALLNASAIVGVSLAIDEHPFESSDEEPLSKLKKKENGNQSENVIIKNERKRKVVSGVTVLRRPSRRFQPMAKVKLEKEEKKNLPPIKEPKYKCEFCDKMWKTKGEWNAHKVSHSDARPFICEICGQAYKHKHALDVHVKMHKGIYEHQCSYCMKAFTQKGALQRHLPIHTGEMPYQCELCGKRFVHRTSFSIHTLAHTGKRHIKCVICNLGVLSKSHLRRHMRIHSGEKPFECLSCGKTFAERYNLVAHQRIHDPNMASARVSRKKQHTCRVCHSSFPTKLKMEEHMVTDHSKVNDDQRHSIFNSAESYIQPKYIIDCEASPKLEISEDSKPQLSPIDVPRRMPQIYQRAEIVRTGSEASVVRVASSIMESSQVWTYVDHS